MLLNDCRTEFMKQVLPRFLNPTTFLKDFLLGVVPALSPLSLEIVRLRGRSFLPGFGVSSQPESFDDTLAVS